MNYKKDFINCLVKHNLKITNEDEDFIELEDNDYYRFTISKTNDKYYVCYSVEDDELTLKQINKIKNILEDLEKALTNNY